MSQERLPEEGESSFDARKQWWQLPYALRADLAQANRASTIKLVLFIAEMSARWHCRWILASYDEIINGLEMFPGKRLQERSGLTNDPSIARALEEAKELKLLAMRQTPYGMAYALPKCYWTLAGLTPRTAYWKYAPSALYGCAYDLEADDNGDYLPDEKTAYTLEAQPLQDVSTAITTRKHSNNNMLAEQFREAAPALPSSIAAVDTSPLDTFSLKTNRDTSPAFSFEKKKKEEVSRLPETPLPLQAQPITTSSVAVSERIEEIPPTAELAKQPTIEETEAARRREEALAAWRAPIDEASATLEKLEPVYQQMMAEYKELSGKALYGDAAITAQMRALGKEVDRLGVQRTRLKDELEELYKRKRP